MCLVIFDAPGLMRYVVNKQKHNQNFGSNKLWTAPSKPSAERKMQAILRKIRKHRCGFLGCTGQSIIIDRPSKTVYAVESGGHLKSIATV